MAEVWELDIPQNQKLVLLAFADHADDAGVCFPSIARVAHKTGYKERQLQDIAKGLRGSGLLETISHSEGGRGKARVYRVRPERGAKIARFSPVKGAEKCTFSVEEGCTPALKRVQSGAQKGAVTTAPQPSRTIIEPSYPSVQRAERAACATIDLVAGRAGRGLFFQLRNWAEGSWRKRFGSKPTWTKKDFVGLARILRVHGDLGLDEFKARWERYLADGDAFVAKQGYSLAFFCSRFDSYIERLGLDFPEARPYDD